MPFELGLVVCLVAGVRVPVPVVVAAEALVGCALAAEAAVFVRLWRRARGRGLGRREAARDAVRAAVPVPVRRLVLHELRVLAGLARWAARRPPHGVGAGDRAVPYAGEQAPVVYVLLFAAAVETVALGLLLARWPVVHLVVLVLDVWGMALLLGLHAACVARPHVVGADGSLRVRYGALVDVRVPARRIVSARVEHRSPGGRTPRFADGVMDLAVGGRTTVTVELDGPVAVVRPLGGRERARVLRFCADDPRAAVEALREAGGRRALPAGRPDGSGG
ncbi:hypothetical protein [Streptomyces glaucosporus]|uniref:hypothetical protein n=1 Tax=Streptomyces glaucosporus TaxID=284044 RepID=UPI0031D77CEC